MGWDEQVWSGLAWAGVVLVWDLVCGRLVGAGLLIRRVLVLGCSAGLGLLSSWAGSV